MRYGYWLPVFGGWLRNVENENMPATWAYVKRLAKRYGRSSEWLDVLDGVWRQEHFSFSGKHYRVEDNVLAPKPVAKPRPTLYAGGESPAAKDLIARKCDAYLMHGDPPERVREKIADLRERRARHNLPPLKFGFAGYAIVSQTELEAQASG